MSMGLIVGIIIGSIVLILGATIAIIFASSRSNKNFYGEWTCQNGVNLLIDSKRFNMNSDQIDIESKYKIVSSEVKDNYSKYTINASATKRIVNGQEYTEPYTTQFQIAMYNKTNNELVMINTISYSLYNCIRK